MSTFVHDCGFGAQCGIDHDVRFRIWAPDCHAVWLERESVGLSAMHPAGSGWFETHVAAPTGCRYRYRLGSGDGEAVPDPAAREQAGGVHGWSVVCDPRNYNWRCPNWRGRPWHEAVIEEVHVGLLGGFGGVRGHLRELAATGITAIELMPVAEFPGARNWGYDGVLPFAPAAAYGTPAELKELIDSAHELGLMVLLDVVYNHFGPDGNYLPRYASPFFRSDVPTPWGAAIDMGRHEVAEFFICNALYWLNEFRFDGLRIDAAHAIADQEWLATLAARVRGTSNGRHVHLVLEHDGNAANLLERGFDAQWDDDFHHAMHVLLTGETRGYYVEYAREPMTLLARSWREGFAWQGEISEYRDGVKRGEPSAHLRSTAFVVFLQNHDQIGNRAFGERLTQLVAPRQLAAALAFVLLSPMIPMLFMGDEYGEQAPFLYFTDHHDELADAVREGRRREFARFAEFSDPAQREQIPDPNAEATFAASRPLLPANLAERRRAVVELIALRQREVVPWLSGPGARMTEVISERALRASWVRGDSRRLHLYLNLGTQPIALPSSSARVLYCSRDDAKYPHGQLAPESLLALLE